MPPPGLAGEISPVGSSAAILDLAGEVDLATVDLLNELFRTVAERGCRAVIVDLSKVTFMDSTGLHALIAGKRLLHDHGSRLFLVPSPQVKRLLDITFPDPMFATRVETVEVAIAMMTLPASGSEIPVGD